MVAAVWESERGATRGAIEAILWFKRAIREVEARVSRSATRSDPYSQSVSSAFPNSHSHQREIRSSCNDAPQFPAYVSRSNVASQQSGLRGLCRALLLSAALSMAATATPALKAQSLAASISLHRVIGSFPLVSVFAPVSDFVGTKAR